MYKAFDLKIENNETWEFDEYLKIGEENVLPENAIDELLNEVIANGTIDGIRLSDALFPTLKKDVFLSYSHNDKELAYSVAGYLNRCFGLSVFADFMFWGGIDNLLKEIDKRYCRKGSEDLYDYRKRNYSTSHVHLILASALAKVMDEAEIVIFLNTDNSVPDIEKALGDKKGNGYTHSPWIYEEILLTSLLRERDPIESRKSKSINESRMYYEEHDLKIRYKLPKGKLIPLAYEDIVNWREEWMENRAEYACALDCLYELCEIQGKIIS